MLLSMKKSEDQKELYFDLDWFFKKCTQEKTAGIYSIYKKNICLYVGQSKNIPSRIATHLSGKYKTVDKIIIYTDSDYTGSEDSDIVLLETEKYLINKLEPIENVLVDFDRDIDTKLIFSQFLDMERGAPIIFKNCHRFTITQEKNTITIYDIYTEGGHDGN